MILVVGCAPSKSAENQRSNSSHIVSKSQVKISKKPLNGAIASIQQIKTYQSYTGTDVKLYKFFYWSNGYKVEALLTEPAKSAKYPLLLRLHGGAAWRGAPHSSIGYTAKQVAHRSNAHTVMLYPEYEGYNESQGKIMGIKTDMTDIHNAIKAAKSLGEIKSDDTYVEGASLGGCLTLMTTIQDPEIRAAVAVSPFVGLTDFMQWATRNAKPGSIFYRQMTWIEKSYGKTINSPKYKERSPNVQSIRAPVLLLQGTADKHVPWQVVKTLAKQMKAAHKTVKLVMYSGGKHGLPSVLYHEESTTVINSWFKKYGLNMRP